MQRESVKQLITFFHCSNFMHIRRPLSSLFVYPRQTLFFQFPCQPFWPLNSRFSFAPHPFWKAIPFFFLIFFFFHAEQARKTPTLAFQVMLIKKKSVIHLSFPQHPLVEVLHRSWAHNFSIFFRIKYFPFHPGILKLIFPVYIVSTYYFFSLFNEVLSSHVTSVISILSSLQSSNLSSNSNFAPHYVNLSGTLGHDSCDFLPISIPPFMESHNSQIYE